MSSEVSSLSGISLHNAGEGSQVAQNGNRTPTAASTSVAAKDDQVSLTESASRLMELENVVSQLPVVDSNRVAEVQRAIATGSLQIDPSEVADKMLAVERGTI